MSFGNTARRHGERPRLPPLTEVHAPGRRRTELPQASTDPVTDIRQYQYRIRSASAILRISGGTSGTRFPSALFQSQEEPNLRVLPLNLCAQIGTRKSEKADETAQVRREVVARHHAVAGNASDSLAPREGALAGQLG
ncbi:hypothetical protein [Caballeronia sp. GAFFF1]|uniref:hypothetical protein n=1 Tax=Caballeronia sp. GAFFF1 TaxID=2921779 RepID=UPI002028D87B|nr:hypothetical protein [Caballeronia sp. GAFFF1]